MRLGLLLVAGSLLLTEISCSNLPRDPEETLEKIQKYHRLRVGLSDHPPWVIRTFGEPQGAEVELVRRFAASLGARPEWHWSTENQQMRALKNFDLDLVVCGLDSDTPWAKQVGLTRPYFRKKHVMAGPPGENAFLVRLETFLATQEPQMEALVKQQ